MDDCNIFDKCDSGVIREYLKAGKGIMEEPVTLKFYQYTIADDPTKGIAKTFVYTQEVSTAIISSISQTDIVYSGGIYQLGDIKVQLRRQLKEIDDKTQSPGDRILWRNDEYRPVGKTATNYIAGYVLYDYVFRRI